MRWIKGPAHGLPRATRVFHYLEGNVISKDQVKGEIKDVAGKVQEKAGQVIGSTDQQVKGLAKQVEGKTQKTVGDVKEVVMEPAGAGAFLLFVLVARARVEPLLGKLDSKYISHRQPDHAQQQRGRKGHETENRTEGQVPAALPRPA